MRNVILIWMSVLALRASAQVIDTAKISVNSAKKAGTIAPDTAIHINKKSGYFVAPAVLVGIGTLSFVVKPIRNFDYYVRGRIAISDPNYNSKLADYLQLSPAVLVYALNLVGDEGKDRFVDRTALIALSGGILTVTDGLKYIAHRTRPYGTDPLSWPSGHTGAAFLAAEYLNQEYGDKSPLYSILGYTVATTTGVLRLYGRAHWFSDCVAGAGFGILSTRLAYLAYPYIRRKLTHTDKKGRSTMVMPTYQNGAPGLVLAMQL